ncbi:hypothetical protein GUITHDRAFT_117115 [Guillardia theta CCMP2712]|uniref:Potassium channel tetramerisation-type BTB domain-containing protein n=1 Tax=Guillardia theta (strain CCMP2712) TaxID=905079 RepID=L1ILB6_GUITC|nr:hypothetical protein GUITHDRAFT_117115 [Guillardia theta CCMP2712]EKX36689.1 hypothetical protein GUITHDRAFT_117115 [Guillardia theta CCMP2712]|mmetsp:Transcript_4974/g.17978  ORF Transcript_4974/g.17978 Transcript_4974/m.17978 type:complete len:437 (-) Transcript_4974:1794-3104(-)|eukprot:XP_005823669.1 hypothetical protein GUITHDRAFT_117115 [Guillardia theta CCMP2712]
MNTTELFGKIHHSIDEYRKPIIECQKDSSEHDPHGPQHEDGSDTCDSHKSSTSGHSTETIILDASGTLIKVAVSTLEKFGPDSVLGRLVSERWRQWNDPIFIDIDPDHLKAILYCYRYARLPSTVNDDIIPVLDAYGLSDFIEPADKLETVADKIDYANDLASGWAQEYIDLEILKVGCLVGLPATSDGPISLSKNRHVIELAGSERVVICTEDEQNVFLLDLARDALEKMKVRTIPAYINCVLPHLRKTLRGYGVHADVVKRAAPPGSNARRSSYLVLELSPLPVALNIQDRVLGAINTAVEWAKPYMDLELTILGCVLSKNDCGGLPVIEMGSHKHVVCIYERSFALLPGNCESPEPEDADADYAIFVPEINEALFQLNVFSMHTYLTYILPLLSKVMQECGVTINHEVKNCKPPSFPGSTQYQYVLLEYTTLH